MFTGTAKHIADLPVIIRQAVSAIGKKADYISGIHGNLCLFPHLRKEDVLAGRINSAGIHERGPTMATRGFFFMAYPPFRILVFTGCSSVQTIQGTQKSLTRIGNDANRLSKRILNILNRQIIQKTVLIFPQHVGGYQNFVAFRPL